jgi:uncharacterized membrane protein YkgB
MAIFTRANLNKIEVWKARNGLNILIISLGLIFIWFVVLKSFPDLRSAETFAGSTIYKLTFGYVVPEVSMPLLTIWESVIGLGLITIYRLRITLLLFYLHIIGTFLLTVFFNYESWTNSLFVPKLLGQYIIKNIVSISSAIVIGATCDEGILISDPLIAKKALHQELLINRFRRHFNTDRDQKVNFR